METIIKFNLRVLLLLLMVTLLLLSTGQLCNAQQYRTETFRIAAQYLSDVTAAHFFGDASYLEIQDNTSKFPNNSLEWILSNFSHGYLTDNNSSDWHSSLYPALSPAASDRNIIQPQSSGIVPFTIKGALGQTADVFQILDNSDNRTFRLTAEGYLEAEGGIHPGYTTSTTSGNIRFTGSDIEGYVGGSWKSLTAGNILEGSGVIKGGSPSSGNVAYWDTANSITGLDGFHYDQANTQLTVEGTVSASQLESTTTTAPPLTVQSTQKVTNLNSDLLDGYDSSYFLSGRYVTLIGGDMSTSTYTVNNPYGHRNVFVEVIEAVPPYNRVFCTKSLPTPNTVQITFSSPQSIQYAVIIEEAEDNTLFGPGLTVEHSLNSTDILFQVWRNSGDYDEIITGAEITSTTCVTIITSTVFSPNEGNVVFKTARDSVNIGDTINHEWNTRFFLSMMMDNSSNEISFAGTRFNKLDEIEIDFSSTPGTDAIKFLYYPIFADPDNNELYILLSGANKDKVSGTHFNPSVNIDVGAVTANIVTVTGEIYSSGEPDSVQTQLDNIKTNYSLNTHNHNPDDILSLMENGLVERVGTNDYRIREIASSSPIIDNATTIPNSDAIYDWVTGLGYITDGNTNWDNIYGFITSPDDSVSGSELDGVFSSTGLLERTGVSSYTTRGIETSSIDDDSSDIPTENAVHDWVTGLGYITDGNTNWDNIYGFVTTSDDTVQGSELDGVFSTTGLLKRTGPATYTTITDNSSNWNTAYGWGNHASAGYIKDGNTNWDNIYGFITSPDDTVQGSELDGVFSTTGLLERTGTATYTTRAIENTTIANGATDIVTENAVYDWVTSYAAQLNHNHSPSQITSGNVFLIGGDTSTNTYTVNNPYGHRNVFVEVIEVAPPYNRVLCTKSLPTTNTVQITFSSPQSIQYVVIIEEAEDNTLFGPGLIVEHSLNSTDILFQVWRNSGNYEEIITGAEITSADYITIITSTVFSSNEGNVVFKTVRDSVNIGDTASELIDHEWNTRFFLSMTMDNSSNEISFAGTRFNKLDEIEINFSSTPGADAIKFLYYPVFADLDNNDLYVLLNGANKDKASGTHFNPSVNIDVGAVTANIVTATESINFSPDSLHYGIVEVDDPYLYIKSNVSIRLDPTWDGASNGIITAAAAIDFDEFLGHKLDLWADSYWIGVEPFTLELGTDRNILLKNDLGYAYMYLNESGTVGDVTVTGQLWSAGVSSSIQSQLDALGGLLGYSVQNTSPLVDNATDIVTANAVYDWVTGLGYITSSALTPYLKKDGSVAMTGDLNMGGQAITNMSGTTNYIGASLSISGGITANTISTTGVIEGDADAVFAGSVSADYFTAAGAGGVTSGGVFTLLTGIRWNAGTLQVKSRNIALQGGIATLLGTETGWTNVPDVP